MCIIIYTTLTLQTNIDTQFSWTSSEKKRKGGFFDEQVRCPKSKNEAARMLKLYLKNVRERQSGNEVKDDVGYIILFL